MRRLRGWFGSRRSILLSSRATPRSAAAAAAQTLGTPKGLQPGTKDPPLVSFHMEQSKARPILVLAIGIKEEDMPRLLDMMVNKSREDGVVPIIVTDHSDLTAFRERELIFEFLPDEAQQKAHAPDLNWPLYRLRRLQLLRRKWRPINTIAFGPSGARLLREWQASPLWEGGPKAAG
jgi:hypothetical protein